MSTVPDAPTNVQVARSAANIAVSFDAPANDGGDPIIEYMVTASNGATATGASSPITVPGLVLGTSYTFTVHATNDIGDSVESTASAAIIPATVPAAPTIASASIEDSQSVVAFTPGDTGGLPIDSYTITAKDTIVTANGGQTATGTASPILVPGLVNGDAYTFSVVATNAVGSSAPSGSSALVIPQPASTSPTIPAPIPNATSFVVNKTINLTQFIDELQTAVGQTVNVTEVMASDGSNENTLWIAPSTLAQATVETVIANHVADPNYGVPESQRAYLDVQKKVLANPDVVLSDADKATAINGMILRLYGISAQ